MAPSVEEILKQSGFSDEDIKKLDAKVVTGFTNVLNTATTAQQAADKAKQEAETTMRAQQDMLSNEINPALDNWATEKANLEAQVAFYRTQNEQARSGGFVPQDAPGYVPPNSTPNPNVNPQTRDATGRFMTNANPVPGSPHYVTTDELNQRLYNSLNETTWAINTYSRLYGKPIPDDLSVLLKEANERHMQFRPYVQQKYNFQSKEDEIKATAQKAHDDSIVKDARQKWEKEQAEAQGSNPDLRVGVSSQYDKLSKAVTTGQLKDPLTMTPVERHQATRTQAQKEMTEREVVQ